MEHKWIFFNPKTSFVEKIKPQFGYCCEPILMDTSRRTNKKLVKAMLAEDISQQK